MKKILLACSLFFLTKSLFSQNNLSINPADTTVCKNALVKIKIAGFSGTATFDWRDSQGKKLSNLPFIEVQTLISESFFCYVMDGTKKDTLTAKVMIKSTIFVPTFASDTIICKGKEVLLYTPFKGKTPLDWASLDGIKCVNPLFCDSILITPNKTNFYTFEDKFTCYQGKSIKIQVDTIPFFASTKEIVLCLGASLDSLSLNKTPDANLLYEWTQIGNVLFNSNAAAPKILPRENVTFKVKITQGKCSTEETIKLIMANLSTLSVMKDTMICPNKPVKLDFSIKPTFPDYTYVWSPGGYSPNGNSIVVSPSQTTNYILELKYLSKKMGNEYYCTTYDTVKVMVKNSPNIVIKITPPDTFLFPLGRKIKLSVEPPQNSISYTWLKNNEQIEDNTTNIESILSVPETVFTVNYKNEFGCDMTITSPVFKTYKPEVIFPSIFNAEEETFRPYYKALGQGVVKIEQLYIYNRWGQIVYELQTEAKAGIIIDNNFKGWDGKKDDTPLPSDVYIVRYRLRYGDESLSDDNSTTNVTLIR